MKKAKFKPRSLIHFNRSIAWQRKVDDFFNKLETSRQYAGKRMDRFLTIAMVASLIILVLTVIYVFVANKGGPTNWAMQLSNIDIEALIRAKQEILVINYLDDDAELFSSVQIARVKASDKLVLAYLPIEQYRTNSKILSDILLEGYDGVYLTGLDSYETCGEADLATCKTENANLVISLSTLARQQKNGFQTYIGDGYGVLETEAIWDAIDGVGKENLFYRDGVERGEEEINYDLAILDQVTAAEKNVLVMEHNLTDRKQTANFCSQSQLHKFVPGSAPTSFNYIDEEKTCK